MKADQMTAVVRSWGETVKAKATWLKVCQLMVEVVKPSKATQAGDFAVGELGLTAEREFGEGEAGACIRIVETREDLAFIRLACPPRRGPRRSCR